MRIITRPDFDGIVCAVLLYDILNISEPVRWVEPYEMEIEASKIKEGDIIANLPYAENCSLWFDHHISNQIDKSFNGAFKIAPSAAGIIYEYYKNQFSRDFNELISEVDKIDSADFSIEEILYPERFPYIMLYLTISNINKTDELYWNKLINMLAKYDIDIIMANKEVQERCNLVIKQNKKYKEHIEKYTTINKKITITDFRSFNIAPKGNRFLIYSIFPESIVSVKIRFDKDNKEKVILSLGQNIFNRKCKINLGTLAAKYDGGGHQGAGSCSFHINDSEKKIAEIIEILKKNEDIDI